MEEFRHGEKCVGGLVWAEVLAFADNKQQLGQNELTFPRTYWCGIEHTSGFLQNHALIEPLERITYNRLK